MANVPQPTALKILAIGSPRSELALLQKKVTAINSKHGPFDACVVVGDLFKDGSDGSEISGVELPVPTYFTLGRNPLPDGLAERLSSDPEIAPNLVFLGKSGVLTTAQGLKIAVVGGVYGDGFGTDEGVFSPRMSEASIASLVADPVLGGAGDESLLKAAREQSAALPSPFRGVDVLLAMSPPPGLNLLSPSFSSSGVTLAPAAPPLAEVVKRARPRYLFWADGEGFWEREPWGWAGADGKDERWTRAVKLGALGDAADGGKAARWFYATSLPAQTPSTAPPARPANATPNPLTLGGGRKRAADDGEESEAKRGKTDGPPPEDYVCKICQTPGHWIQDCAQKQDPSKPPEGYTCNICQSPDHYIRECPQREERRNRKPPAGYTCKVCGEAETHYVRECPVVKERDQERSKRREMGAAECWFCLSNPKVTKHLIVAIGSETYVTLPKGQLIPTHGTESLVPGGGHVLIIPVAHHPTILSIPADDALNVVTELEAYKSALRACYAEYGAVPVTFEVGRHAGKGGHAHVQVIPVPKELAGKVADGFIKAGQASGITWEAEPERALSRAGPTGNYFKVECPDGQRLVHLLRGNFDLQFGRLVLAGILGLHDRVNWKDCVQTDAEDREDAQKFKKALQPFLPK